MSQRFSKWTLEDEVKLFCLVERSKLSYDEIQHSHFPELTVNQLRNKYYGLVRRKPNLMTDNHVIVQKIMDPHQYKVDQVSQLLLLLKDD